jgi:diguanylate cyclase (GGDEF)-like protein
LRTAAALASAAAGVSASWWVRRHEQRRAPQPEPLPLADPADSAQQAGRHAARALDAPPRDALAEFLRDVRDALGADEVVFWPVSPDGEGLCAGSWASAAPAPRVTPDSTILPLIAWSAHERVVQSTAAADGSWVGTAPVVGDDQLLGALSVHAARTPAGSPDEVKRWLGRHARHVGEIVALTHTRLEFELQSHRSQRLLHAAREFQSLRSVEELAQAICKAALAVSSAEGAALVRWTPRESAGRVESVEGASGVRAGQPVVAGSQLAAVCESGLPRLWEDARLLDGDPPLYASTEPRQVPGALAVVPLVGRDGVVGAVVLEGRSAGCVQVRDVRSIKLLAALGALSLETLGDFEAAEREANTDKLTGLPNRRAFAAQFGPALDRADRFGEPVAVVMCDVDHFKAVNDTYGHDVGDLVLQSIGATLQRGVRAVDTCARHGGEEFTLLLPRTNRAGATELADRLRRAIEMRPVRVGGRELRVTASFGVAIYPASVTSRDELLAAADRALYAAKRDGRNCVRSADATSVFD